MTWWNDGNCQDLKNEDKWEKSYDNIKGRDKDCTMKEMTNKAAYGQIWRDGNKNG